MRRAAAALQGDAQINNDLSGHVDACVDAVLRSPLVATDPIWYQQSDLASDHMKNPATLNATTKAAANRLASCVLYHVQDTHAKLGQTVQ